jgi:flavin-dependent dehydrogenase
MTRHDAIIVGGGPAGSSCARDLVRAGLDVLVIERAQFPRHKPCAGWITLPVLDALGVDAAEYAEGRTLQPIEGFRVCVCGRAGCDAAFGRTVSYGIRRCEFDHYLLERSGARTAMGMAVTRIERAGDRWVVNGGLEAPLLVGAGGHFCPVAARLSPRSPSGPLVLAQEVEVPLTPAEADACRTRPTLPSLFFCPDLRGYGWVFRKGGFLNVGFGRQDPDRFVEHSRQFMAFLAADREIPARVPASWHGHAYLLWGLPQRPSVADGAVLAGDAAGLAAPSSGEGIRTAIESGQFAARAIIDAGGTYTRARLEPYRDLLERRYGRPPVAADGPISRRADRFQRALGAHLVGQPWFARHLLASRFVGPQPPVSWQRAARSPR